MKRLTPASRPALLAASPAFAALKVGDKAPDFTAPGALAGKDFTSPCPRP
jgi:peroxiredoxin Q/BCP